PGRVEDLIGFLHVEVGLVRLGGVLRRRVQEVRGHWSASAVDLLLHRVAIDEQGEGLTDGRIGEERVRRFEARALAVDLFVGVRLIALDVLDVTALRRLELPAAALLHAAHDLFLDLHVPCVVVLTGLYDRAPGRHGVAAALHLDRVEVRPVGHVIGRVQLAADDIAGLEVDELVRARADRLEVGRRLPRLAALERLEHGLGDDHAAVAAEAVRPERRRVLEGQLDRVAVELVDPRDVLVRADRGGRGRGIGRVLPVEHDVVGRERFAVVPDDVLLQLPGDRLAVLGHRAVLDRGNFGGENRRQIAVGIEGRQRLIEDPRAVLILGTGREMRIQQRRRLPKEHLHRTAAPAFRWGVLDFRLRGGDARRGQHLGRQRRRQPETNHHLHETAAAERADTNLLDQGPKVALFHGCVLPRSHTGDHRWRPRYALYQYGSRHMAV